MANAADAHRNGGQFGKIPGWFGHGDVPAPDSHWDPGALKWSALFAMAKAIEAAVQPVAVPLPHPCAVAVAKPAAAVVAAASLDADLIGAVSRADAATKLAILKALGAH